MKLLLKNATLICPQNSLHLKKTDLLIVDGIISKIASIIEDSEAEIIDYPNLHISKGWFDSSVSFGEPGYEERETLDNGTRVAALSGFTAIGLNPNTNPLNDVETAVSYLKNYSKGVATEIHPIACLTKGEDGQYLTEMYMLQKLGAIGFGDYKKSIKSTTLLKTGMQYAQYFGGLILSFPSDVELGKKGIIHEGKVSARIGIAGQPSMVESIQIQRDIEILNYAKGKLHIPYLSTKKGVELIREAKSRGLDISCSVGLGHLLFTDDKVEDFDVNYKILPPLRLEEDREVLREGVLDGTIDMVTSMHEPINIELKHLEFGQAAYGSIGLEAMFGGLNKLFSLEQTISILTRGQARFELKSPSIEVGQKANLTLFNPENDFVFQKENILSTSKNCAFLGEKMKGNVYGIINEKKAVLV